MKWGALIVAESMCTAVAMLLLGWALLYQFPMASLRAMGTWRVVVVRAGEADEPVAYLDETTWTGEFQREMLAGFTLTWNTVAVALMLLVVSSGIRMVLRKWYRDKPQVV